MATPKPQVRSTFATPVLVHFLPVAQEANSDLRPLVLERKISACACVRGPGEYRDITARPGAFWSGIYFIDDGYQKSDDEALGGEIELGDPRGALPAMVAPNLAFRIPGGLTAGGIETIRPQTGMIILHPSWLPRGERRYDGASQRVTVEFDLSVP
jgi:hypothetical protein